MPTRRWPVRLSDAAEADVSQILQWTVERFGERQASAYARMLSATFGTLADGPAAPGVKARDDLRPGLFALRVGRHGRRGRHFVLFRIGGDGDGRDMVVVLRVLHDAMDLTRHLPEAGGNRR